MNYRQSGGLMRLAPSAIHHCEPSFGFTIGELALLNSTAFSRPDQRAAFTMLELTVATVILGIMAAVVVPRWSRTLDNTRIRGAERSIQSDLALLKRLSVRRGHTISVAFSTGSGQVSLTPPLPGSLGDAQGNVDYAKNLPGLIFTSANFNGSNRFNISMYGELLSSDSGEPLSAALIQVAYGSQEEELDFLLASYGVESSDQFFGNPSAGTNDTGVEDDNTTLEGSESYAAASSESSSKESGISSESSSKGSGISSFFKKLFGL